MRFIQTLAESGIRTTTFAWGRRGFTARRLNRHAAERSFRYYTVLSVDAAFEFVSQGRMRVRLFGRRVGAPPIRIKDIRLEDGRLTAHLVSVWPTWAELADRMAKEHAKR